jgi:septum formation protein
MLDNLKKYKVILASNSPRRKELLAGLGVEYEVRTLPDVDESYPETLRGADIPLYISSQQFFPSRRVRGKNHLIFLQII